MGRREEIQAEIQKWQGKLNQLNRMPEDRFHFNTILQFAAVNGDKWFIRKIGEESWVNLKNNTSSDLAGWILEAEEKAGAFELYEMRLQPQPLYAKT